MHGPLPPTLSPVSFLPGRNTMEMRTPNSEPFQGNMRLSEIYGPEPAQNSAESRNAREVGFPV